MSEYRRKKPHFSDELEFQYQIKYKCTPYDNWMMLISRGADKDEAFALIQDQMDDIWKEYCARKQEEIMQNTFQSVSDADIPFNFTESENDILDHLYHIQEEQPLFIPSEYDLHGEQLEFAIT